MQHEFLKKALTSMVTPKSLLSDNLQILLITV